MTYNTYSTRMEALEALYELREWGKDPANYSVKKLGDQWVLVQK